MRGSACKALSRYASAMGFNEPERKILKRKYMATPGPKRKAFKERMVKETKGR